MLPSILLLLLPTLCNTASLPPQAQKPLLVEESQYSSDHDRPTVQKHRPLRGKFLHITDFHPDHFYKAHASLETSCHRGSGATGVLGTELSDCDSPFTLVNATFDWLKENIRDEIDFVIWTGDSARHDNDEKIPRTQKEVLDLNGYMVDKMWEVFGKGDRGGGGDDNDDDPTNEFAIPVVPTLGNNDIMPHNIMEIGPNFWTKTYTAMWAPFIPEAQRHSFERGGWFFTEVIPNKLAVFNLNTLYFFNHNGAVDGCAKSAEPGYEQMQWLRIQLEFLRQRGMKAIMMGHVPPAKTDSKEAWDVTCWQLYALWMERYRDVVVGSMYGHMNIDHFMLQDFHDVKKKTKKGKLKSVGTKSARVMDEEISVQSSKEYLSDLRHDWSKIPDAPDKIRDEILHESRLGKLWDVLRRKKGRKHHKSKKEKYLKKIGGRYAERYSVSLVSASVVPNYFPSFRIIEYNITGLDDIPASSPSAPAPDDFDTSIPSNEDAFLLRKKHHSRKSKKHKKKHRPRKKKPRYSTPHPPSETSPPGPAYSAQSLTWLSYTQYYANLTTINAALEAAIHKRHPQSDVEFKFEVEYDTRNDTIFNMRDLTVRSWVDLARRIGKYDPINSYDLDDKHAQKNACGVEAEDDAVDGLKKKHKKKKGKGKKRKDKKKHRKETEELWFTFLRRAYVGAKGDEELREDFAGL